MRDTVLLFTSLKEPVDALTDEQAGQLFKAILAYQTGEAVSLDGLLNVVFLQIKQQLDYNNDKYNEMCKKRSDAGKKGMLSRWGKVDNTDNDVITNDNNVTSVITDDNKNNHNDNDTDNDNDNVNENVSYQQIVDMYNDTCVSYPRVRAVSDKRKKAIKARLRKYTVDDLQEVFTLAEQSDFLKGQNDRNWNADFDWLMSEGNIPKVLERKYNDDRKGVNNGLDNADAKRDREIDEILKHINDPEEPLF